jgi:hypothetical protein
LLPSRVDSIAYTDAFHARRKAAESGPITAAAINILDIPAKKLSDLYVLGGDAHIKKYKHIESA